MRSDPEQWMIYDEATVRAMVAGLEVMCLELAGSALAEHEDIEMRALGNLATRIADARIRRMGGMLDDGASDVEREMAGHVVALLSYLSGEGGRPEDSLDGMWAAAVWLDSRAMAEGVNGTGWVRALVKGVRDGG